MTNRPFYFATIRNLTAAFGSLFNDVYVQRNKSDGSLDSCIKVPLAYAPADKTVVMLQQRNPVQQNNGLDLKVVLPRMAFELTGMAYDSTRKTQTINKTVYVPPSDISFNAATDVNLTTNVFTKSNHGLLTGRKVIYDRNAGTAIGGMTDGNYYYIVKIDNNTFTLSSSSDIECSGVGTPVDITSLGTGTQLFKVPYASQYNPVPYTFEYSLYVFVKYIDDGLQIIEQILPYFTPFYTVTLNDIKAYGVQRDVPISITSITSEDQYQGDVADDRIITWTLTFSANGWVYPPVKDAAGVIKTADVNFLELDLDQKLTTVTVEVDPLTADRDDEYTIKTTITDW
jgi:hypothetical protein